jgi:DNA-binding HxlR family transcriptional regulator
VAREGARALVCPCPPVGLIDVVGKKWAVCVISLLGQYGTVRFGPIQRCLSGVSPATLTATLRALEKAHLVRRTPAESARGPVRAYALTATGRVLYDRLLPLAEWLRERPLLQLR